MRTESIDSPYNYPAYPNHYDLMLPQLTRDLPFYPDLACAVEKAAGDKLSLCRAWNLHYQHWQIDRAYRQLADFPRRYAEWEEIGFCFLYVDMYRSTKPEQMAWGEWEPIVKSLVQRAVLLGIMVIPRDTRESASWLDRNIKRVPLPNSSYPAYYRALQTGKRLPIISGEYRYQADLDGLRDWLDYLVKRGSPKIP